MFCKLTIVPSSRTSFEVRTSLLAVGLALPLRADRREVVSHQAGRPATGRAACEVQEREALHGKDLLPRERRCRAWRDLGERSWVHFRLVTKTWRCRTVG